jgi:hypothetical protein
LKLQATRTRSLAQHLASVEALLSDVAVGEAVAARTEWLRKRDEAERLRAATFPEAVLAGTGSEPWKLMWNDAHTLSEQHAYPGKPFPVVDDGARCVICQQGIDHDTAERLTQFEAFVASTTERELVERRTQRGGTPNHHVPLNQRICYRFPPIWVPLATTSCAKRARERASHKPISPLVRA